MLIVLDTNIIRQDWRLQSEAFNRMLDFSVKTCTPVVLPEIVMMEIGRLYEAEVKKSFSNFESAFGELQRLTRGNSIHRLSNPDFTSIRLEYQIYLRKELHRFHLIEIPSKADGLPDVLLRWREGIKPFKAGKDSFRDSVIWLSVLDLAKHDRRDTVCFISGNIHDFAGNEGDNLHSDLQNEVEKLGLDVRFFRSLNHFNEVHTNHLSFLDEQWLSANIDWKFLNLSVLEGVRGIHCGYYFEAFSRKISKDYDGILNYDPLQAEYDKSILGFNVGWKAKNEYDIWMNLGGEVLVEYFLDDEHFNFIMVYFHTEVSIRIKDKVIVSYEANYYEENSGLSIDDAYEV
jgi:hypothetical protein